MKMPVKKNYGLLCVLNIWDNSSTQLNKMYDKGLIIFRHFNAKMLHILYIQCTINGSAIHCHCLIKFLCFKHFY